MVTDPMMDPIELFGQWYERARGAGLELPQAMTLATAGRFGKPAARIVLLSGFDHRGFVFHTNCSIWPRCSTTPFPHRVSKAYCGVSITAPSTC